MTKKTEDLDAELAVMAQCVRALDTLDPTVQARVLLYLARRFGAVVPTAIAPTYQFQYGYGKERPAAGGGGE